MREYFIDGIPYISKEQFCKLAHVRKANALKLIQSGLIPYIDIGDQTHRYLIRQSDAEAYLTDRAHDPAKYSFQRKSRIQTYPGKFDRNFANELSQYASVLWKDEPQMLTVQQVHDLLGYSEHVIRRWYTTCGLAVVRLGTRAYIPKKGLLRFIGSRSFHSIKEKSAAHVDLIRSVDYEGAYKQSLYQDWKDGEITQQEYRDMKADYERQTSDISAVLTRLNAERAELANGVDNEHPALVAFMKYQNIEALNREILVELVDYIKVYENGNISVKFKFADELRKIAEYIEINTTEDTTVAG